MKDNLFLVINNMACNYDKNDFINKSFNTLYKCVNGNYFNTKLFIIDDSGSKISDLQFYNYYKDLDRYPEVCVLSNKVNQNLLRSRFKLFEVIDMDSLSNTWIRFMDSGDIAYYSEKFQMELMMKMNDTNADWYLFPQGIMSEYENRTTLDSFYYTCFGDTKDKRRIVESTLSSFNACPMWNKVFRADLLYNVYQAIKHYNDGEIPYLFHTEDFLINCLYAFYSSGISTINTVHILYDNKNGDSATRKVTKEYYDEMKRQVDITRNILSLFYCEDQLNDGIPINIKKYYINKKLDHYADRFILE